MSNKTQLQTNNTNLQNLILEVNSARDIVASLPEAGGGSGGVETCTVTIKCEPSDLSPVVNSLAAIIFTKYDNNTVSSVYWSRESTEHIYQYNIDNAVCGSLMYIVFTGPF